MTNGVSSPAAATGSEALKPFRTAGDGSPLFCFPGSGGDPDVFEELVAALPEGQPVYAIDMEWLCEARQDFTIEQLAVTHLDLIRTIQKRGPYYFCGYSFGGLVAYEMATLLIDAGDSASLVALLDAPNPAQMANLSAADSRRFRKTYLLDRLKRYALQLVRGDLKAFTARARAFVISRAGRFFLPAIKVAFRLIGKPLPRLMRANDPAFMKAWGAYVPKRYSKDVVCFRVGDRGPEHDRDPSMGWETCALGGVHVHVVPASHVGMMAMPSVGIIAERLATYLDSGVRPK
jgi:thioesterase domain-containing protein